MPQVTRVSGPPAQLLLHWHGYATSWVTITTDGSTEQYSGDSLFSSFRGDSTRCLLSLNWATCRCLPIRTVCVQVPHNSRTTASQNKPNISHAVGCHVSKDCDPTCIDSKHTCTPHTATVYKGKNIPDELHMDSRKSPSVQTEIIKSM